MEKAAALRTARELIEFDGRRADRRAGETGDLDRVRRGLYIGRDTWNALGPADRYLTAIDAAARSLEGDVVFSHETALCLLGLPNPAPWPSEIHLICERRSGGRTQLDIRRHCLGLEAVPTVVVGDLECTSPVRTALDMALSRPFASAVMVADAVASDDPGFASDFAGILDALGARYRGSARARRVLDFANPGSESPGESLSRVLIAQLGFAPPVLQHEVRDRDGLAGRLDFYWPSVGVGGEFDGRGKYLDASMTGGRSAAEVVLAEKRREDRLRRTLRGFARWSSEDLRIPGRLATILASAGVPRTVPSRGTRARPR